ncbi:MAG TPA: hypothetical protein DEP66_04760 [Acidimicrobiaceae bacterium]|nr:hypothetical protein [Acidimicrobiaceae bacterium]HCB37509.1 hypothetical protein [Acidimicrobiaceae bacterium]
MAGGGHDESVGDGAPDAALPRPAVLDDLQRRRMRTLAAVPLGFGLLGYVGQIALPSLVDTRPVVLLALNATDIVLPAVAHQMPLLVFMVLGTFRLFVTDPFLYRLGRDFGPATHAFLEAEFGPRHRLVRALRWLEKRVSRSAVGWLVLYAMPGYPMCLLAGISRMSQRWFVVVNLAGTVSRLAVVWWLSGVFEGPVGATVRFIGRYSLPLTAAMIVFVLLRATLSRRR